MARSPYYGSSYLDYLSFPNPHLCFFFIVVFFVLSLTWYLNYESILEDTISHLKLVFMFSPLFLLLLLHFFSGGLSFDVPWPGQDSIHSAGSSPWGVAALLVVILLMVWYQSDFQERWFPFGAK
ncbi:hypothetical protein EUTSA_v10015028mg [Eutrema salsugineum]|uniref:Uncharacterized protein n=1 Tax=Eutrema salsugineum TaxID=72664 RepID=V4LQB2_EUTSA|nr:uncharacterized protein LOC18017848 [Eutrema salsugineum]ESQ42003.1 hypothetical protein EUTSA_v10015028mg [Eutrema salsugineum]